MSLAVETETYDPNGLVAGDYPLRAMPVTIASGAALTRGAVVGVVAASGKYVLSDDGAADGSEAPVGVLAQDVDASGGDVAGVSVYFSGAFDAAQCTLGGAHTAATVNAAFRATGAPLFLLDRHPL